MYGKYLAWLRRQMEQDDSLPRISRNENKGVPKDLPKVNPSQSVRLPEKPAKPVKREVEKREVQKEHRKEEETKSSATTLTITVPRPTIRIPHSLNLKKYPLWIIMVFIIGGGSMAVVPTLASLDLASLAGESGPTVNVDSQSFVVSRVRFDPTSTISMSGATAVGATAVFTQVVKANFLSEMGDLVTISGITIQNLGTTNAIAAIEVIAPDGVSVDVRSPPGAGNELRLLGTNTFALPIDGGSVPVPGTADIELRLIILTGPIDPGESQTFSIQVGVITLD